MEASGYVPRGGTAVPPSALALSFVESSSPAEDDLLPGLCLLVQLWLGQVRTAPRRTSSPPAAAAPAAAAAAALPPAPGRLPTACPPPAHRLPTACPPPPQVAFPLFRNTAEAPPSPSLVPYFEDTRVEALLELYEQGGGDRLAAAQSLGSAFGKLRAALEELPLQAAAAPRGDASRLLLSLGAGAALLAALALALGRRGGVHAAAQQQQQPPPPVRVSAAAGGGGRLVSPQPQLRAPAAEALVRRWHDAKAAALGPSYDTGRLRSALAEPLLGQTLAKVSRPASLPASPPRHSPPPVLPAAGRGKHTHPPASRPRAARCGPPQVRRFREQGWFMRYKVARLKVSSVDESQLGSTGAAVVVATVEESASMFGVDGRQEDGYSSVFDTEYRVVRGADGGWVISQLKVLGREPSVRHV
jgi:hypothetical protein